MPDIKKIKLGDTMYNIKDEAAYVKPSTGIPQSDLDHSTQTTLTTINDLLTSDDATVDTIREVLDVFAAYPEETTIVNALAGKAAVDHPHVLTPTTATAVTAINSGSGTFTPTTRYLHETTASAAPHTHTHNVTVSGTSGKNSGTGVSVVTGVASNGTATALTGVKVTAQPTVSLAENTSSDTGRAQYVKSISGGSGDLTTDTTATNGIKYVESISSTGASASGTDKAGSENHTHNYDKTTGVSLTANTSTAAGRITYVESISGGSGTLEAYDAATGGNTKVSNGTRIGYITSLSKSGYTPAGSVSLTNGTAPSLDWNTETNTDTPYISDLTKGSYTPAGSVAFTAGTAPSMGAATIKYLGASASGTAVGANGTAAAITGFGTHTTGTAIKELNTTTIKNPTVTSGTAASWGASVSNGVLSFSFTANTPTAVTTSNVTVATGAKSTIAPITALGTATTATCLTGVKVTAQPTISLAAYTSNATGRIKYVEAQGSFTQGDTPPKSASFTGTATTALVTGGTTKYAKFSPGTIPKTSASFSGTNSTAVVTGGTTYYLAHGHSAASATTKYLSAAPSNTSTASAGPSATTTFVTGVTGGTTTATTKYLHHTHTAASATTRYMSATASGTGVGANGTATVLTGVKASGTATVAPNEHTHTFSDNATAVATTASPVTVITDLTANTTAATGDIAYLESATHTHTGASVKATDTVLKSVTID